MAILGHTLRDAAHYELRDEYARWLTGGVVVALLLHAGAAILGPPWVARPFELAPPKKIIDVVDVPVYVPAKPAAIVRPDINLGALDPVVDVFNPLDVQPVEKMDDLLRPPVTPSADYANGTPAPFAGVATRAPEILHRVAATYPELARMAEAEGTVVLLVTVGSEGKVTAAEIIESDAVQSLEKAAIAAAKQWLFRPAFQGNQAVAVQVRVPFEFRLN